MTAKIQILLKSVPPLDIATSTFQLAPCAPPSTAMLRLLSEVKLPDQVPIPSSTSIGNDPIVPFNDCAFFTVKLGSGCVEVHNATERLIPVAEGTLREMLGVDWLSESGRISFRTSC